MVSNSKSKPTIQYPFDSPFWHGHCCHDTSTSFKGRNLCVCIDGTSNKFGDKNTNVIELYNMIIKGLGTQQLTWYNSGIGTYASPSDRDSTWERIRQKINSVVELAFATRFEDTILGAYGWLSNNYKDGDRIFLFGFSRGAFQVRVLAAMIDKVGLFYKGNDMQIAFAYEVYRDTKSKDPSLTKRFNDFLFKHKKHNLNGETYASMAEHFKRTFSQKNVRVHFVGVWDTVSSLGVVRGQKMLPGTVDGMKHVCYFRHALALDERRVKFLPEYVYGGCAKETTDEPDTDATATSQTPNNPNVIPQILEVWFAGSHSDIGGGNRVNLGLNSRPPPLRWMVYEALSVGLRTERWALQPDPNDLSRDKGVNKSREPVSIKESLHGVWWLLEVLPLKRLTYSRAPKVGGEHTTRSLHMGGGRKLHNGQKIHESVDLNKYTPKARPPPPSSTNADPESWDTIRDNFDTWKVVDADTAIRALVRRCHDHDSSVILKRIASSKRDDVLEAVYEEVIQILTTRNGQENQLSEEDKIKIIFVASDILKDSKPKLYDFAEIRNEAIESAKESTSADFRRRVHSFLYEYTRWWMPVRGHNDSVSSVAFSSDGNHIVSAYRDGMIRLWDSTNMKQVMSFHSGLENKVDCVVFSADGQNIVSGSSDGALRIWDFKDNKDQCRIVKLPENERPAQIWAVSYFQGGIVSGTSTGHLQIWRPQESSNTASSTGMTCDCSWKAHARQICTVAVSQDGTKIVSGSRDNTLCIWDARTKEKIGGSLRGHTDWVRSVALSRDGTMIVSGSDDKTVRLWSVETCKQIGGPLLGHTRHVLSVHFSRDGQFVVSGSEDNTVRVWDVSTHREATPTNSKHTAPVSSVAFSPDGMRVVSGSDDHTIGIWDLSLMLSPWNTLPRPSSTPNTADTNPKVPTEPPADESKPASLGVSQSEGIKAPSAKSPKAEEIKAVLPKENSTRQLDELNSNIVTPPSKAPQLEAQLKTVRVEVTNNLQPVESSNRFLSDMLVWV